jgi:4-hydroxyphenylpyruvate dioxygenase
MGVKHARASDVSFNPAGTQGFAFVEFTSAQQSLLHALFKQLGFSAVSKHKSKPLTWYQQGEIFFLVNDHPDGFTKDFEDQHGASACAMGFTVEDAQQAYEYAHSHGAKKCLPKMLEFQVPAIYGIGGSLLYFIDHKNNPFRASKQSNTKNHFEKITQPAKNTSVGLLEIDHLTHNVHRGKMDKWAGFYEGIFNFREIRYFDIKGKHSGLLSRAMTSPCGKIKIPINESRDAKSQIEEYLKEYNGEGIQHIALTTVDIIGTVKKLKQNGVKFMDVPDSYYDRIDERLPGHAQEINALREHKILIDGHKEEGQWKLLLQIFTDTMIGPIFFEIIQRLGDDGFGEGNFQALFEAMEDDQIRRGTLSPGE